MIKAEVLIETKNWNEIIKNPKRQIHYVLKKFPDYYKFKHKKVFITVLLTNNKKIKLLNKKFRNKNKSTDILSFPFFDKINLNKNLKSNNIYLGDIAISYEDFSKKNINNFQNGFIKIFIHGFLHLLNFDHKSKKEYEIMHSVENKIFQNIKE
tara:strand:+ start:180 stop:638 length:459 start_codon:yes stop_codon:yes gene_type:complete